MHRRSLALALMVAALALPLSASQFIKLPFDQVAREAAFAVRGQVVDTWSVWDDAHEVIFTYATLRVTRYFGEATGPDTLVVREVGGTVDGYTQEAIGFPVLRRGEQVVFFLAATEDGSSYRIHAYNQGKYLVKSRMGVEVLVDDPVKQGEERLASPDGPRHRMTTDAATEDALTIEEFAGMVEAARAGHAVDVNQQQ